MGTEATPLFNVLRRQDEDGHRGTNVLDGLAGQFGEEHRGKLGCDLHSGEVGSDRLVVLAVSLCDDNGADDHGGGCHIEQQRLPREGGR